MEHYRRPGFPANKRGSKGTSPLGLEDFLTSSSPHPSIPGIWTRPIPTHETLIWTWRWRGHPHLLTLLNTGHGVGLSPACPCGRASSRGWWQSPNYQRRHDHAHDDPEVAALGLWDGLFTLSTAAHESKVSQWVLALLYWTVNAPPTSRNPTPFQLKTTGRDDDPWRQKSRMQ